MMKDDIIQQNDITILIGNIRKEVSGYMPTSPSRFKLGHIVIRMMCFFVESDKYWWIQAPFTIGIQTPTELESMLTWGHNEPI